MKLQTFGGGQASRLQPQLIQANQGVIFDNIDNTGAVLESVKDSSDTAIVVQTYPKWYRAGAEWLSSNVVTDYLEFQRVMYSTDRSTRPQKYSNGASNNLGIVRPANRPTAVQTARAEQIEEITANNKIDAGDLPSDELVYLLFNVKDGVYSTALEITIDESNTVTTRATVVSRTIGAIEANRNQVNTLTDPTNRSVEFSNIQGNYADSAILFRRYNGVWRQVNEFVTQAEVFLDDTYDISANAELDTSLISGFNGVYQYVYTYYNSADGTESAPSLISTEREITSGKIQLSGLNNSSDPQVTNKRIYRLGGDITQFTLVTSLDNTTTSYLDELLDSELEGTLLESDNYYEAPSGLKFLSESYAMLFGAIGSNLRFTPIGQPNAWPPEYQLEFDDDITGLGPVANGLLVMTESRTFVVTGTGPLSLSQQPLRGDQGCIAFESIQQVVEGTLIWASKDGLCISSGNNVKSVTKDALGDTVLDPISSAVLNEQYYCHNKDGSTLVWDYRFTPVLKTLALGVSALAVAEGEIYGTKEGTLRKLFDSSELLDFTFKSARFVEGSYVLEKTYKKFYIRSEGDIMIKIIIDGSTVATRQLLGTKTHEIQIPQDDQRGFSVQMELSGKGIVHEVEYEAGKMRSG